MMRLIDADELKMYLIQANEWQEIITMDDVLEFIERQTLIDTSKNLLCTINVNMDTDEVIGRTKELGWGPVEHGQWIDKYGDGDWHCTRCGAIVEKHEQDYRNWYFCYHCGARMDGDKNG